MKRVNSLALLITLIFALCSVSAYAGTLTLDRMLAKLTKPRLTTFQKLELIDEYKDEIVKGTARVKDVLKSFGAEGEALVYLKRRCRGTEYEIVVAVSQESAEKIKKGRAVNFEAVFAGMSFQTLRFEEGEIKPRMWWFF